MHRNWVDLGSRCHALRCLGHGSVWYVNAHSVYECRMGAGAAAGGWGGGRGCCCGCTGCDGGGVAVLAYANDCDRFLPLNGVTFKNWDILWALFKEIGGSRDLLR